MKPKVGTPLHFKAEFYDGDYYSWRVLFCRKNKTSRIAAEFFGKGARHFAIEHALNLNTLGAEKDFQ